MASSRFVALRPAMAAALPVVLGVAGLGCVNLDKPASLVECSSGRNGPCVDNGNRDAPSARDGRGDGDRADAGPDALNGAPEPPDAGSSADGPTSADVAGSALDASPDLSPASLDLAIPDAPVDARATDLGGADAGDGPGPDLRVADEPPLAPDAADGPTVGPDGGDAAPDLPPDKPFVTDATDVGVAADRPDAGTTVVLIKSGRGDVLMTGYGWVTLGSSDTVTSPTCGSANAPITNASPCTTQTNWNSASALCVTGSIPALPEVPTAADYANNWGLQVGLNAKDPKAPIGQVFSTIALNVSGAPLTGLRIELHRSADPVGTTYCALWTSSDPVALTSFNTECWNNNGVFLNAADLPTIDSVGLQVTSGNSAIAVTNLCIQSIVFGK